MCVAELNVSLLPCRHRWYHLTRPCSPSANLSNCPNKLGLSGWEIKCDFCPYCSGWNLSNSEYRLVGNDRNPSIGGLSRTPSLSLSAARKDSRRGSLTRTDSSSSITLMASEKNKAMNARVDAYLRVLPEKTALMESRIGEDEADGVAGLPHTLTDSSADDVDSGSQSGSGGQPSLENKKGIFKKMRKHSKKFSLSMFK